MESFNSLLQKNAFDRQRWATRDQPATTGKTLRSLSISPGATKAESIATQITAQPMR